MPTAEYGHALYYPYIHLQDENWLKLAALYYEGLSRIVPQGYETRDSYIVRALNDEFQFIRDLSPGYEADEIAEDFLEFARDELTDAIKRKEILSNIEKRLAPKSGFPLHVGNGLS